MNNFDEMHSLFLGEINPDREDLQITLFAWQLIGLAQLNCFSYSEVSENVYIPYNKTIPRVFDIVRRIEQICKENEISIAVSKNCSRFVICQTGFDFYKVGDLPFNLLYPKPLGYSHWFSSREDNFALYQEWEMTEEGVDRAMLETHQFFKVSTTTLKYQDI